MFVWYWTAFGEWGSGQFDTDSYAWTDDEFVQLCIVRSSDCCWMIPPAFGEWECE